MLLLVTIGLVLVGAVALVIGFVSNSLGPIYLSIACSVIAGIVLVVFSRMARRREGTSTAAAPSPEPARGSWASRPTPAPDSAPSAPAAAPRPSPAPPPPPVPSSRPEPAPAMSASEATGAGATATMTAPRPGAAGDFDFPIEDYDNLKASEVLSHLDDLSLDELDMVREREEHGKNRATVLKRVDLRIEELEAREDGGGPRAGVIAGDAGDFAAAPGGAADEADDDFPIPNYESLSADEIIARLDDLDDDEVDMVAAREERGLNRVEVLDYIDNMFEEVGPDGGPFAAPPPPSRPAKKASVKKVAAKKAAVKGVAAKKAPAAKVGAARAASAKSAGRPAAVTTKAASRKSAAGPGTAKKAAGTAKAARGAAAKKAAPTKAAAKRAAVKKR